MSSDLKFVRVYMTEADKMLNAVMSYLHFEAEVQGVSVFKAIAGYGKSGAMHTLGSAEANSENLPLVLEFFDNQDKITKAIEQLKTMVGADHIVSWTVQIP